MAAFRNFFFLFLFFLFGCETPTKPQLSGVNANRINYLPDGKIFFTNVRSVYYLKQSMESAKIDFYRHRQRLDVDTLPLIELAIADAWDRDEAYLIAEPCAYFSNYDSIAIDWQDKKNGMKGVIWYKQGNPVQSTAFADDLGSLLKQPDVILTCTGKPFMPEDARDIYLTTLNDYRKWVSHK